MIIADNFLANGAMRQLNINTDNKKKQMEKLSTGYKINRSADDAAGLAISEKMRWQIRGLDRSSNNAQDGVSYVQVADGALGEVQSMLHRLNELSIQSATDTNTDSDRGAINEEVQEIKKEINNIFLNTEFNTRKIWCGDVVEERTVTKYKQVPAVTINSTSVISTINNTNKNAVPKSSYTIAADTTGIKISWTGYNNTRYTSNTIPWDSTITGSHSFSLAANMDTTTYPETAGIDLQYSYTVHDEANLSDVITALNGKTIGNYVSKSEYVQGTTYSGNPLDRITFSTSINYSELLNDNKDMVSADSTYIEGVKNSSGAYDNVSNPSLGASSSPFVFTFTDSAGDTITSTVSSTSYSATSTNEPDENIWWKYYTRTDGSRYKSTKSYTASNPCTLDSIYEAAQNSSANSGLSNSLYGGYAILSFGLKNSGGTSIGSMSMRVGINSGETLTNIQSRLADLKGVDIYSNSGGTTLRSYTSKANSSNKVDEPYQVQETVYADKNNVIIQSGATEGNTVTISYDNMSLNYLGIEDMAVTTRDKASNAITLISDALDKVSSQRSQFGAYQNRLEHVVNVNRNTSENVSASESKIKDTDIEKTVSETAKSDILMQAGQMILTQANHTPETVINLLMGQ